MEIWPVEAHLSPVFWEQTEVRSSRDYSANFPIANVDNAPGQPKLYLDSGPGVQEAGSFGLNVSRSNYRQFRINSFAEKQRKFAVNFVWPEEGR